jgi:TonB family protein
MASPTKIAQELPDTLPEDFGEWDGEGSPSGPSTDTGVLDPAPSTVTIPKSPARPRDPQVSAGRASELPRKSAASTPVTVHGDNKVYQPRLRPMVVDRSPSPAALRPANARAIEAPAAPAHRTNGAPVERKRNAPQVSAAVLTEADEVLFHSFRNSGVEEEEKKKPAKKKLIIAGSVAAACVLLLLVILIPLLRHSSANAAKQNLDQAPTVTDVQPSDTDIKPSPYDNTQAAATKPASVPAAQQQLGADDATASDGGTTSSAPVQSQMMNEQLSAPSRIPQAEKVASVPEAAPPPAGFGGMQGLGGNGAMGSVLSSQGQLKVKAAPPRIVTVSSGVAVGMLVQKTTPIYPPIAKTAGVSGTVVLEAVISKAGAIEDLHVVSGPVMLRKAAEDAVRTWRYRPYKLNNEPTEVQTTINVIFSLSS